MSIDADAVRRIARLARIAVTDHEIKGLQSELNAMLAFIGRLMEVDIAGIEPMTSVIPMTLKQRSDEVTDGGVAGDILRNAPASDGEFFLVPKVVE